MIIDYLYHISISAGGGGGGGGGDLHKNQPALTQEQFLRRA